MPIHDTGHLEHAFESGYITIVGDNLHNYQAYWAHPRWGDHRFSSIALIHDWWGMTPVVRRLADYFAGYGYYVIAPNLYGTDADGKARLAHTPTEALALLEETQLTRYEGVSATLTVLETHHRTTTKVAAIGLGMGGTHAYEAALKRTDLEAAVSWGGFPQQFLGKFGACITPILALYGEREPFTKPSVIRALRDELSQTPLADKHRLQLIPNAAHDFFFEHPTPAQTAIGQTVLRHTMNFLDVFIDKPNRK